jgi:S1-C subfamily serine protease
MRAGFLLLSLLVVVGIMLVMYRTYSLPAVQVGQQAEQAAQQMTGRDANGVAAYKSYKAQVHLRGPQFDGIEITDLTPGGPMDTYYGLKVNDVVVGISGNNVTTFGDYDSAKGQLDQAYQSAAQLSVIRDGNTITLPAGGTKSPLDTLVGQH